MLPLKNPSKVNSCEFLVDPNTGVGRSHDKMLVCIRNSKKIITTISVFRKRSIVRTHIYKYILRGFFHVAQSMKDIIINIKGYQR